MAETLQPLQERFSGAGPLDAKMQPVEVYGDLGVIPRSQRYVGMVVTVINDTVNSDGKMADYWLVGGTTNAHWQKKDSGVIIYDEDPEI